MAKSSCLAGYLRDTKEREKKFTLYLEVEILAFNGVLMDSSRWFLEECSPTWHASQWVWNYPPLCQLLKTWFHKSNKMGKSRSSAILQLTHFCSEAVDSPTNCVRVCIVLVVLFCERRLLWLLSRGGKQSRCRTIWSMISWSSWRGHIGVYQGWLNHQRNRNLHYLLLPGPLMRHQIRVNATTN